MSVQTSYSRSQAIALAGMLVSLADKDVISRSVEGVAGIGFGVAVGRGTDKDNQAVLGTADFLGISVRSLDREGAMNTGAIKYSEKETAAILRDGYIWAVCPTGCVPGNLVNYVTATGVLDSGAAGAGETQLDDAEWDSTTAAGALGIIRIKSTLTTAGS